MSASRLPFVLAVATAACGAKHALPDAPPPPDLQGVHATLEAYRSAVGERDLAAVPEFFVADDRFVWVEDGAIAYRGVDQVVQALAALPPAAFETTYDDVHVDPVGQGAALARLTFTTTMALPGADPFVFSGMMTLSMEHDGSSWRIVGGHTSTAREDAW